MTPEEARALWVKELRSGDWKQTKGYLRRQDACCCLGVACELYWEQTGELKPQLSHHGTYSYGHERGNLPWEVQCWLGLERASGFHDQDLTVLNDSGRSFTEIADVIERHG